MEDIRIGIFVVLMLGVALYHHPQETIRMVMLPLIGLYVVLEVMREIFSSLLFSKGKENE